MSWIAWQCGNHIIYYFGCLDHSHQDKNTGGQPQTDFNPFHIKPIVCLHCLILFPWSKPSPNASADLSQGRLNNGIWLAQFSVLCVWFAAGFLHDNMITQMLGGVAKATKGGICTVKFWIGPWIQFGHFISVLLVIIFAAERIQVLTRFCIFQNFPLCFVSCVLSRRGLTLSLSSSVSVLPPTFTTLIFCYFLLFWYFRFPS